MNLETELLKVVQGAIKRSNKTSGYDTPATVTRIEDDIAWVHIDGGVDETPVRKTIDAKEGDTVQVRVAGGKAWLTGNATRPPTDDATAKYAVNIANETNTKVVEVQNYVVEQIDAQKAVIGDLEADTAKIHDLTADQLTATVGYVDDLTTGNVKASDIISDHADVGTLKTTKADISDLNAEKARIDDLEADHVSTTDLQATNAEITNLKSSKADVTDLQATNAKVTNLEATKADISVLESDYAKIDLANVNNAYIKNGVFDTAAIVDEQVFTVTGNKATIKEINADEINVRNLNAKNLKIETADGYIQLGDKKTPTKEFIDSLTNELNDRIDGAIETFTSTAVPTLSNYPANDWETDDERATHVGDVCYVVNDQIAQNGYCYRFTLSGSTFSWQLIKDSDVTAALRRLQTAEGKIEGIESFDEEIASFKTDTEEELSSLKTKTTSLETSIGDKVDKTTFNEVKQTVDENSSTITTLSETTTNLRSDLDNLEIGGRNLIPKSRNLKSFVVENSSIATATFTDNDVTITNIHEESVTYGIYYDFNDTLVHGEEYTLSFEAHNIVGMCRYSVGNNGGNPWSSIVPFTQAVEGKNVVTFKIPANADITFIRLYISVTSLNSSFTVSNIKLERGNRATDWSPAPEDLEESISTVSNTVNEVKQTADGNSASIRELTQTVESKADSSTVSTLSQTVNEVKQTATSNSSTISSLTTTLGTNADGTSKTGDIVHKVSSVEQDLSGFKTTVGETYHKISDFNTFKSANDQAVADAKKAGTDAQADLDSYKGTVEDTYATKSSVTQTANSIKQEVSSTYTKQETFNSYKNSNDEAVADAKKAGTDAQADLNGYKSTNDAAVNAVRTTADAAKSAIDNLEVGGRNLLRDTLWTSEVIAKKIARNGNLSYGKWSREANAKIEAQENGLCKITTASPNYLYGVYQDIVLERSCSYVLSADVGDSFFIGISTAGSWPAKGDGWKPYGATRQYIKFTTADGDSSRRVYIYAKAATDTDAELVSYVNKIKLEKGTIPTDWTPAPEDLEGDISSVSSELESVKTTYVTKTSWETKNDEIAGKITEAETTTKTYTDGKITQEVADRNAAITAKATEITTNVAETYTAKTDFDNLKIGGRNLLKYTELPEYTGSLATGWTQWDTRASVSQTEEGIKIESADSSIAAFRVPLVYDNAVVGAEEYTISFLYRTNCTEVTVYLMCVSGGNKAMSREITPSETEWQYFSSTITFNSTSGQTTNSIMLPYQSNKWFEIKNRSLKLEKGNRATDWTKAIEDVNDRLSKAETSISQKADSVTVTALRTDVDNIKIGGENLLNKSSNLKGFTVENASKASATFTDNDVTVTNIGGGVYGIFYNIDNVESLAEYTLSFDCSAKQGLARVSVGDVTHAGGGGREWASALPYQNINVGYNAHSFAVPDGCTKIRVYFSVANTDDSMTLSKVKLEKGNKATDWSPSYKDLESYADSSAETAVSAAKAEIKVTTDGISSEVSKKVGSSEIISSINQSAEEITINANRVNFTNYSMHRFISPEEFSAESSAYVTKTVDGDSMKIARTNEGDGNYGVYFDIPCEVGKWYSVTFTVTETTIPSDSNALFTFGGQNNGSWSWSNIGRKNYTGLKVGKVSYSTGMAMPEGQTHLRIYLGFSSKETYVTIRDVYLLEGDASTVIDGSQIVTGSITADKIQTNTITVGSLQDGASYATSASVDGKIAGVSVGGRNLLQGSKNLSNFISEGAAYVTVTRTNDDCTVTNITSTTTRYGIYFDETNISGNTEYTWSFDILSENGSVCYSVGKEGNGWSGLVTWTTAKVGRNKCTFTVPEGATWIRLYLSTGGNGSAFTITNSKLERGNKATDWTPAPEELAATATNYITNITSDGVFVHTSGDNSISTGSGVHIGASAIRIIKAGIEYIKAWISGSNSFVRIGAESINNTTQGNVLIDQDSVDIRKGTEVLSTFTSNGASLGKNSDTTEVGMCNDQFKITAGEVSDDQFRAELFTTDDAGYPIQDIFMHATKRENNNVSESSSKYSAQIQDIDESTFASSSNQNTARLEKDGEVGSAGLSLVSSMIDNRGSKQAMVSSLLTARSSYLDGDLLTDRAYASVQVTAGGLGTTSEGMINLIGDVYSTSGRNVKVLWTGGYYMTASHTANLSDQVSNQLNGIVLVWSAYTSGTVRDYDWAFQFIPKWLVKMYPGTGCDYVMMNNSLTDGTVCKKYVYVYDNKVVGNDNNTATGTGYANNAKVLRAVIGI